LGSLLEVPLEVPLEIPLEILLEVPLDNPWKAPERDVDVRACQTGQVVAYFGK
jgi:hypothetical protein